jgi:hypothetical protein
MNSFIKATGYTIPIDMCAREKLFFETMNGQLQKQIVTLNPSQAD